MRARRALGFFQTILVTVTGVTAACGGTMVVDDGTSDDGSDASAGRDGGRKADGGPWDGTDAEEPPAFTPPPTGTCVTGTTAFDPSLCCDADGGGQGCSMSVPPGACNLDCTKICANVAPEAGEGAMQFCSYTQADSADGGPASVYYACGTCGMGRVPAGTVACAEGETLGERLAYQAYYEAVSVNAFERLAAVLDAAGASDLAVRARRHAEDEARHAAIFTELARARGASVRVPEATAELPSLLELALENAAEGCVRETYGALVTLHQAAHAEDADVRAAFAAIAADEAEHAAFSWELAAWFEARLGPADVAAMYAARRAATTALRPSLRGDALARALGMPSPSLAGALFDRVLAEAPSLAA